jgi:hypothetical protein
MLLAGYIIHPGKTVVKPQLKTAAGRFAERFVGREFLIKFLSIEGHLLLRLHLLTIWLYSGNITMKQKIKE